MVTLRSITCKKETQADIKLEEQKGARKLRRKRKEKEICCPVELTSPV
jgi:hypothetical protein